MPKGLDWISQKFDEFLSPASNGSRTSLLYLFISALVIATTIFIIAIIILWTGKIDKVGTFGDFLGGTLNPILTFITFMALLITIVLQQTELSDTRKELAASARALEAQLQSFDRQNFESTFFQMLNLHNTIVNSIDIKTGLSSGGGGGGVGMLKNNIGRDCFVIFYNNYHYLYEQFAEHTTEKIKVQKAYDKFWEKNQQDLAHYYRYLYNVLRFVYEYKGVDDKTRYIKLLRAQLSDYELALLFYTALNNNGMNYWLYIHEYEIFDNLPSNLLLDPEHKSFYSSRSFGEPKAVGPMEWPPAVLAARHESVKDADPLFECN